MLTYIVFQLFLSVDLRANPPAIKPDLTPVAYKPP